MIMLGHFNILATDDSN